MAPSPSVTLGSHGGKALESHSTGNEIAGKGETSDVEARWGKHEYHYTDHKGRPQKKVKRWFGYSVNGIFAECGKDHCRRRGCRFPLSRSAVRTKVQPPFSPRCDDSDICHVKTECGIDCGCACSVPAHKPINFAKREASSLFADAEGRNMRNKFNELPDKFNYCSSKYEINTLQF